VRPRPPRSAARPSPAAERETSLDRSLLAHVGWSALVAVGALALIGIELGSACPPGGPLAFGDCVAIRPFAIAVVGFAAVCYVTALSAVRWWTTGLRRRGLADGRAARDWYLLAATVGLVIAPLFAFTTLSALR
jgi:hypothetical protein